MRIARLSAAGLAAGAVLALTAVPLAASAHVTVTPSGTAAGSYTVLTFAFSHGCEGSPTTALTFDIPESIDSVSPTLNPKVAQSVGTMPPNAGCVRSQRAAFSTRSAAG